ncbi:alpha-2-macroglobulin-like protein 1 [Limosa lapponica baueri]|uniref:Alpha-2-macroglobulin-like protein 1 n=1 Tax=Limosa lapponica baueri TaxID=1758121 RepID=A0A2I0TFH9_LIMLA|nr:alpha-2-macroglobulin-like protein 1 [Limosa lapponica baueri]
MKILTNTRIKKPVSCMRPGFEKKLYSGKDHVLENHVIRGDSAPHSDDTKKPKPRTLFPETWIWDLVSVGDEGQASLQVAVPDTITEWNANTFCVADIGFGFSSLAALRVFQPFFVDLSLPYSVIQGETFSLKATVFNYLKDCIQVRTTLTETPELKVDDCPSCPFTSCLCTNEAKTFEWNVTATRLGKVNVTVSSVAEDSHNLCDNRIAVTPLQGARDTVIKPLLVKPGGVLQEKTQNAFLCAAGDIMGPALQNLDRLLELPFGCGEQNMVQFAPNIFILQYLNKTRQLDPEIEDKALKFLRTALQEMLAVKYIKDVAGDTMLDNALRCLKNVTLGKTSLYVKSLMAYVFTLTKDMEMREQLLGMLEKETVVSLQALARYAALIPQEIRDVKVTVRGEEASPLEFHVHRSNKLVLHQAPLLAVPATYTVQATGSGCVYVQLEKIPLVKKTEINPDKVIIYLEELGETSLKLNISVEQDVEVQNLKAATVHVYDYYKPALLKILRLLFKINATLIHQKCPVQRHHHCPTPAGHAIPDTSQDAVGLLGHLGTLLAHVNRHPQVLFCWAAFQPLFPKPVALPGVVVTEMRDPALGLIEPHPIGLGPLIQPVQIPL